jgi:tetratricopeptide (TPR) repeat protein
MKLTTSMKRAALSMVPVAMAFTLGLGSTGCSRDHIDAVNLTNEGDKALSVNIEGAIQKYEQAIQLQPMNHLMIWKLAKAYEKKEDWDKMAAALSQATTVAPTYANYYEKQGFALTKLAEAGAQDKWEDAKKPLKDCVDKDPNRAWCYQLLGEANWATDDIQGALENFTKAVEHDPRVPYFYVTLAELYQTLKFYKEAQAVLEQGTKLVVPDEENREHVYNMYLLTFNVAQFRQDKPAMLAAVERAYEIGGESHPEARFNLGSTYASMDPPQKEKAKQYLEAFEKRSCKGEGNKKFKDQCAQASAFMQKLGS